MQTLDVSDVEISFGITSYILKARIEVVLSGWLDPYQFKQSDCAVWLTEKNAAHKHERPPESVSAKPGSGMLVAKVMTAESHASLSGPNYT